MVVLELILNFLSSQIHYRNKIFCPVQVLIVGKRAEEVAGEVRRVIEQLGSNNPKPGRYSLSDIQLFFPLITEQKGNPQL